MTFNQTFKVDEVISHSLPEVIADRMTSAGTLEGGLFSMHDKTMSNSVLSSWRWLLGQDAVALVASAWRRGIRLSRETVGLWICLACCRGAGRRRASGRRN